jgi:hypothetical protein
VWHIPTQECIDLTLSLFQSMCLLFVHFPAIIFTPQAYLWSPHLLLGRTTYKFCIQYTVTVSISMQQYILYYPSTPSLHVSALLGHLQVMITVLDCHTVRCVYINIYFLF